MSSLDVDFHLIVVKAVDADVGQVALSSEQTEVEWNPFDELE